MYLKNKIKYTRGFTLIELLVVIAIIGLLSSVIVAPIQSARKKGRDAQRVSSLKSIQTALAFYYDDNGTYPIVGTWTGECPSYGGVSNSNVIPGLVPNYLPRMPVDPLNKTPNTGGDANCFLYYSDGNQYKVLLHATTETITGPGPFYDPVRPTWAWQVCEGTTACSW